jgi:hypothetical protein
MKTCFGIKKKTTKRVNPQRYNKYDMYQDRQERKYTNYPWFHNEGSSFAVRSFSIFHRFPHRVTFYGGHSNSEREQSW